MRRTLLAALLVLGCASGRVMLVPGETARTAADDPQAAEARAAGISLAVDGTAWKGVPVSERITPLWVHIENEGQAPIEIHAADFALTAPGHETRTALSALSASDSRMEHVSNGDPALDSTECPALSGLGGPGVGDGYSRVETSNAQALRANALPEGTLAPGAHVEGYLYFDHVNSLGPSLELHARLSDDQQHVSEVSVPLSAVRG
jgi:hypothetical protein